MTTDTAKGLRGMFNAKPELFDVVKDLVDHDNFLYDSGGGENNIEGWNESIPTLLEAAREFPALQAWVKQLDAFEERETEKCVA